MDKKSWLDFLGVRLKSQISIENARKIETGALFLLFLGSFATASHALNELGNSGTHASKVIFLMLYHAVMVLGFYLPHLAGKGQKPLARLLDIHDFTALIFLWLALSFYSVIGLVLGYQTATEPSDFGASVFAPFIFWSNFLFLFSYVGFFIFSFISYLSAPSSLFKFLEYMEKTFKPLLGVHLALLFGLGLVYSEMSPIGSPVFFEQFRIAGLFWVFIGTSILLIGRSMRESSVGAIAGLQLDIVSGRIEKAEDILLRFKEAFASPRLAGSMNRISHNIAQKSHEIAKFSHEVVSFIAHEKPSEIDLVKVEDRYRKAESLCRKLEKESHQFLTKVYLFDLNEAEREKVGELRDQFLRELRNAKLELASIRKRLDEKLVSLKKDILPPLPSLPEAKPEPAKISHEKL